MFSLVFLGFSNLYNKTFFKTYLLIEGVSMSQTINITEQDILKQVKLSCQIPELIKSITNRQIIAKAAEEADIKITTEELQKAADEIRLARKLNNADETFAWLKSNNLSVDDFEEMIYGTVISVKLTQHLFVDKVEPYFYENQFNYASAIIYEIILDDQELAMELFYEIQEGESSFFDIAYQYIQDKELKRKCGYLGIVKRKEMKPEISAKVFASTSPQVLKPIVTAKGVHLIKIEEIIQPELDNKLRYQIFVDLYTEWLDQQVQRANIINNLEIVD